MMEIYESRFPPPLPKSPPVPPIKAFLIVAAGSLLVLGALLTRIKEQKQQEIINARQKAADTVQLEEAPKKKNRKCEWVA